VREDGDGWGVAYAAVVEVVGVDGLDAVRRCNAPC
jgi:hypothetical protein